MIFSFSGCFSLPEDYEDIDNNAADSAEEETKKPNDEKGDAEDAHLVAEKIEEVELDNVRWDEISGYCEKDGEYAIVSCEGEVSENTFKLIENIAEDYYAVSTETTELTTEPESRNVFGVADVDGDVIVPEEYARIKYLNDRFFMVYTVTETTENKENAILYLTDNAFSLDAAEGDILYAGKWEIYDVEEDELVPDVSGNTNVSVSAYENIICVDYDEYYKADGTELDDAEVFLNGCYAIEEDENIIVYDENYEKLFEGDNGLYIYDSTESSPDYFIADDNDSSGEFIIDRKGKKVSEEIELNIYDVIFDKYIVVSDDGNYGLYDFDGEEIIACEYKDIEFDDQFGIEILALETEDDVTYVYCDGTEIAKADVTEDTYLDGMVFAAPDGDDDVYLNLSTGELDIKSVIRMYSINWCVETRKEDDDGTKQGVIDVITGENIIDDKYYDIIALGDYVVCSDGDGMYTFYELTAEY